MFKTRKSSSIPIQIFIFGVFAIFIFTIISFVISNNNQKNAMILNLNSLEEVYRDKDLFYFYLETDSRDVGYSEKVKSAAEKIGATYEGGFVEIKREAIKQNRDNAFSIIYRFKIVP